jgi:hypothetical protein
VENSIGMTVRTKSGRPHLRGVVVDDTGAFVRSFEHQCSDGKDHEMLHGLGQALASELAGQPVRGVVIREVGYARGSGMTGAVKNRLRAEGVALGVARAVTERVAVTDSVGIGHLLGVTPEAADALGAAVVAGGFEQPAAAALAARRL